MKRFVNLFMIDNYIFMFYNDNLSYFFSTDPQLNLQGISFCQNLNFALFCQNRQHIARFATSHLPNSGRRNRNSSALLLFVKQKKQ